MSDGTPGVGMIATSHPLAAEAGRAILAKGGTAADAAVAAAAVLTVVDPRSTGLGGDLFCLYWKAGAHAPVGLEAAGIGPEALTLESVRAAGFESMPRSGPWSVTVPGAPAGWETLVSRHGSLGLDVILDDAIRYAREGVEIREVIAKEWLPNADKLRRDEYAARVFLPGGRPPTVGQTVANLDLAETLDTFAREGAAPFYTGAIAAAIAEAVTNAGGVLSADDLAAWGGPTWVSPISTRFRGVDVFEMPPPGQGVVALESLALYGGFQAGDAGLDDHRLVECLKAAIDDAAAVVADPLFCGDRTGDLLDPAYLDRRRAAMGEQASQARTASTSTDTVYVAVVDAAGNACSLIQSLYEGFGSGVGVPGTGLVLQNRASGFTLADGHPNRPEPRKRPFHTIIPAVLGRAGEFFGCLGVVGGYMQPQGQAQILRNVLDRGMSAQEAVDAPRLRVFAGTEVQLEPGFDLRVAAELAGRGHHLADLPRFECGGAQLILAGADGLQGGSDFRKGGAVASTYAR